MEEIYRKLAALVLKIRTIEIIFVRICSIPLLRKISRAGAIVTRIPVIANEPFLRTSQFENYKLRVNISEYSGIHYYFLREHGCLWFVDSLVKNGDVFVDIGANMGCYTFRMAAAVGDKGQVFAFEPQPSLQSLLAESLHLNPGFANRVHIDPRCIFRESNKTVDFFLSAEKTSTGLASLYEGEMRDSNRKVSVNTVTLDDFWKQSIQKPINVLKIDVETAELEVVKGGMDVFKRHLAHVIILETRKNSEAFNRIAECGYESFYIDIKKRTLVATPKIESGVWGDYLLVARPEGQERIQSI